jgi:hypothetical protein
MGLPRELVDYIMDMLRNDLRALKACSLTCRAMFASTRRLIYRTLRLPPQSYFRDPTGLRFVSLMSERGLLQYARKVHIHLPPTFNPDILLPHLRHFQSLDRIHTLAIDYYDAVAWAFPEHYKTCFVHFYPTLTSLTLCHSSGHYRLILQFALQFPNLENLCLDSVEYEWWPGPDMTIPAIVDQSPPLRGRLRLVGAVAVAQYLIDLAYELPNGINFRSVEFGGFAGSDAQHILNGCAHTLENLTIIPSETGTHRLLFLSYYDERLFLAGGEELVGLGFKGIEVLHRLTLRMSCHQMESFKPDTLLGVLSTVTSPVFHEFVLELDGFPSWFDEASPMHRDRWEGIDELLEERFAERGDFMVIIRTGGSYYPETFQRHAKESFPLLARRGCIYFERFRD